ncbi:uncharacterized protein LOC129582168 [Paramacrobiotus metropolitanus]|uniref:uncharacterized protein LOC129582168 n=1 Tax=Paramacrobiotus metropolitanus TaxID=2943436 RepID=UPI0024462A52|nr:uncharacterized protein LOC129582168 [Paramacrobiotus metropolitanus]
MAFLKHRMNSVGVLGANGLMYCGRVVGAANNGLLLEFHGFQRERFLFPFDKVFTSWPTQESHVATNSDELYRKMPIELLVPETKSGPWIWVPAEMTIVDFDTIFCQWFEAVIVHWRNEASGALCTDIVLAERIRRGLTYECTKPGEFAKGSVPLNEEVRSMSPEKLEDLMKRLNEYFRSKLNSGAVIVDLVDGRLDYIYRPDLCNSYADKEILARVHFESTHLTQRWLTSNLVENSGNVSPDPLLLPAEVLLQVFAHLDTVTQTALGAVCASWNWMMESPTLASTIAIKASRDFQTSWEYSKINHFFYVAAIYKRLRPCTQRVVVANKHSEMGIRDAWRVLDMIRYVADHESAIRLRTLHLSRRNFHWGIHCANNFLRWEECWQHQHDLTKAQLYPNCLRCFVELYSTLPCDAIRLTNCTVTLICSIFELSGRKDLRPTVSVEILTAHVKLGDDFECTLWNALETALSMPRAEELVELSQWLAQLDDSHTDAKIAVCKTLCAAQSSDPRPSSHYRGKKWCVDGLQHLQLEKLSRLALHFLLQVHTLPCDAVLRTNTDSAASNAFHNVQPKSLLSLMCAVGMSNRKVGPNSSRLASSEIEQWLAQLDNSRKDAIVVCKTLCAQSGDPRPSSHYCEKKWCVDGLQHLQLDKLSHLALHFLLKVQSQAGRMTY